MVKILDLKTSDIFNDLLMNNNNSELNLSDSIENWFNVYTKIQKPYKNEDEDFYNCSTPNYSDYGVNLPLITEQNKLSNSTINRIEDDLKINVINLDVGIKKINVSLNKGEVVIDVN